MEFFSVGLWVLDDLSDNEDDEGDNPNEADHCSQSVDACRVVVHGHFVAQGNAGQT